MTPGREPRAVVFDMDGVLLDSEPFWQRAEMEVFGAAGVRLERRDCLRTMGMRVDEVVEYWKERRPWDLEAWPPERVARRILDRVCALIRRDGRVLPGVRESMEFLRRRGHRLALATSSPERVVDAVIGALSLERRFEVAVSAEHEPRGKPDPGVYTTAARRLGIEPRRCVAIEDSLAGLHAARAAGMRCVMVPDESLRGAPDLDSADLVLDSLASLPSRWEAVRRARPTP